LRKLFLAGTLHESLQQLSEPSMNPCSQPCANPSKNLARNPRRIPRDLARTHAVNLMGIPPKAEQVTLEGSRTDKHKTKAKFS